MPTRLPLPTDFPPTLHLSITPPPPTSPHPSNILILLHGLGDTLSPFTTLAQQLALPETTCICLQAPTPLPFDLGGFHWGDDIEFEGGTGEMDMDGMFERAVGVMREVVIGDVLIEKCGYKRREIIFFGFGQGAMAALATAVATSEQELGGVISIGGPLPASCTASKIVKTPVLVLGGHSGTMITRSSLDRLKNCFESVEYHKWDRGGDGMPRTREEMLPIMRFFGRRLRSWKGAMEGSVEVG